MTLDQIIKLATDAGFENADEPGFWISDGFHLTEIEMFAALVAAAEREACAKACEKLIDTFSSSQYKTGQPWSSIGERFAVSSCADAIRARVK